MPYIRVRSVSACWRSEMIQLSHKTLVGTQRQLTKLYIVIMSYTCVKTKRDVHATQPAASIIAQTIYSLLCSALA